VIGPAVNWVTSDDAGLVHAVMRGANWAPQTRAVCGVMSTDFLQGESGAPGKPLCGICKDMLKEMASG
jgi:hypothetical protein